MSATFSHFLIYGRYWLVAVSLAGAMTFPTRAFAQWWGSKAAELDKLAPLLRIKPGMTLAEVGAGSGAVAVAAAEKVGPTGHVYATEIDEKRLGQIRKAADLTGLTN